MIIPTGIKPWLTLYGVGHQMYLCKAGGVNNTNFIIASNGAVASLYTSPTGIVRNVGMHYFAPLAPGGPILPHWNISAGPETGLDSSALFVGSVLSRLASPINPESSIPDLFLNVTAATGAMPSGGPVININRASSNHGLGPADTSCCTKVGDTFEIPYTAYYVYYVNA